MILAIGLTGVACSLAVLGTELLNIAVVEGATAFPWGRLPDLLIALFIAAIITIRERRLRLIGIGYFLAYGAFRIAMGVLLLRLTSLIDTSLSSLPTTVAMVIGAWSVGGVASIVAGAMLLMHPKARAYYQSTEPATAAASAQQALRADGQER